MNIIKSDYDIKKYHRNGCAKLYLWNDDAVTTRACKWFDDNNIGALNFRCKAWILVKRVSTNIIEEKIAKHFNIDPKNVKFSEKCGCACGCSKGYNVTLPTGHPFINHNISADVSMDITEADLVRLEDAINKKADKKLAKEIKENACIVV